jgi:hypothetical protein
MSLSPDRSCVSSEKGRRLMPNRRMVPICTYVAHAVVPTDEIAAAIQTRSRRSLNYNQPSQTPGPYIQGLAPSACTFLTRVSGNKAGGCPDSESDDEEKTLPRLLYKSFVY